MCNRSGPVSVGVVEETLTEFFEVNTLVNVLVAPLRPFSSLHHDYMQITYTNYYVRFTNTWFPLPLKDSAMLIHIGPLECWTVIYRLSWGGSRMILPSSQLNAVFFKNYLLYSLPKRCMTTQSRDIPYRGESQEGPIWAGAIHWAIGFVWMWSAKAHALSTHPSAISSKNHHLLMSKPWSYSWLSASRQRRNVELLLSISS